jgi:hypothetical protein
MASTRKPALRHVTIAADGSFAWDAQEFMDPAGGFSFSDIFAASPALQKEVADAEAERRRARDNCHRFGSTSADAGAVIQTSRRRATLTGRP